MQAPVPVGEIFTNTVVKVDDNGDTTKAGEGGNKKQKSLTHIVTFDSFCRVLVRNGAV